MDVGLKYWDMWHVWNKTRWIICPVRHTTHLGSTLTYELEKRAMRHLKSLSSDEDDTILLFPQTKETPSVGGEPIFIIFDSNLQLWKCWDMPLFWKWSGSLCDDASLRLNLGLLHCTSRWLYLWLFGLQRGPHKKEGVEMHWVQEKDMIGWESLTWI